MARARKPPSAARSTTSPRKLYETGVPRAHPTKVGAVSSPRARGAAP